MSLTTKNIRSLILATLQGVKTRISWELIY